MPWPRRPGSGSDRPPRAEPTPREAEERSASRSERQARRAERNPAARAATGRPASRRSSRSARAEGGPRRQRTRSGARPDRDGEASRRPRSDLLSRVLVAVPAAIVAIVFVNLGGLAFALFMIVVGVVCLHELYRMLARWRPAPAVGFAALAGMVIAARYGTARDVLEVAVAALPITFLMIVARGQPRASTVSIAGTLLGIFWIGFAFAHATLLRELPHGGGIIIDILVGTFLGDTAAYFGGRLFGRRLLAPSISPHKTVEGLFCGMLIAILSIFVAGLYQDWLTQGDALLLGLTVAALGPLGDLFESLVKRDAGAKDAGNVFGAHGGALDRLDAVIFTIVAGYYVWLAVMH
jgi:phosphatidate cytidylyltransferase